MIKKTFTVSLFLYVIFFHMVNAEETYLEPGKLIFSQGGYLQSYPGTTDASSKSNLNGYLKVGNEKGLEFSGSILEITNSNTAPFTLSKSFTTDLHTSPASDVNPTYLFSGSKLNKFVLMESKDSKFGFSAYVGSTGSGFTPSMLYIQKKKELGIYNTVLNDFVYVLRFPTEVRVGIGTSIPRSALEVAGNLKLSGGLSLPADTMRSSAEAQGNTGWGNSLYLCQTPIEITEVDHNVIFFVTCKIKTIGGRPNFRIYVTGGPGVSDSSPRVYPGWVGYNGNVPGGGTYYRDAATIGLSWSKLLAKGSYTAYVIVNGVYGPNFEVKLSYIKMMAGTTGSPFPITGGAFPEAEETSDYSLLSTDLSNTFFTSNTLVLTPPGYSSTDEFDATSILHNVKGGLLLRSKKGLRDLWVSKLKIYDKSQKYDFLVVKDHPQTGNTAYSTPLVTGSSTGPTGFTAYPAYIKEAYDVFNRTATVLEQPEINDERQNEAAAKISYSAGDFHFKNKVNISNAIIANSYGVHISPEPVEPVQTSPILNVAGEIIVNGLLQAKMGFIKQTTLTAAISFPFTTRATTITKRADPLNLTVPPFSTASSRVKVMVSAILPFKLHNTGSTYINNNMGYKITLLVNSTIVGSGYIGQSSHIRNQGFSRLYTLQINGIIPDIPAGQSYPVDIQITNNIGYPIGDVPLYLLADEFNKANIIYIGTIL